MQSYLAAVTLALAQAPLMRSTPTENVYSLIVVLAQFSRLVPGHEALKKGLQRDFWTTVELVKKIAKLIFAAGDSLWFYVIGVIGIYIGALISMFLYPLIGALLGLTSSLVAWAGTRGCKASPWMWLIVAWQSGMILTILIKGQF